jgi:excisionase family DNA binding protein
MSNHESPKEGNVNHDLVSVEEAARVLGVAPKTIRNWQYQKRIPHVKIFGVIRFKRGDLESLISEGYSG